MAALAEEVARQNADRLAAVTAILVGPGEEDVDARVAVVGIELLRAHDGAGERAGDFDRERRRPGRPEQLLPDPVLVERVPPAGDLGFPQRVVDRTEIVRDERTERDALAAQQHRYWRRR